MYSLGFDWEADRLLLVHRRRRRAATTTCRSCTASAASASSTEYDARPPARLRRLPPGAHRQRARTPSASTTSGARCSTRSTCTPRPRDHLDDRIWPILEQQVEAALEALARAGRAASGRCAASRSTSRRPRSCAGSPSTAARGWPGCAARTTRPREWELAADEIKQDILANGVDERGVFTQYYGSTALDASLLLAPLLRFLPPDDPRIRATVLAIADELTVDGLVLRYRVEETDDGLQRRGGHVHDLLVLAGLGAVRDRRAPAGPRAVREAAVVRRPARAVRRGDRPAQRPPPRQLPAGVHPPGADQRRPARDRAEETDGAIDDRPTS